MAAGEPGGVVGDPGVVRCRRGGEATSARSARGLYCFLRPVRGGPARVPSRQHWPMGKRSSEGWAEHPRPGPMRSHTVAFRGAEARAPPLPLLPLARPRPLQSGSYFHGLRARPARWDCFPTDHVTRALPPFLPLSLSLPLSPPPPPSVPQHARAQPFS